jgi:succinyl-CoA synthetase beta subunit
MAKISEFQGKSFLKMSGIKIPKGETATSPEAAKTVAENIGKPVVVKAQVLASGRYQAGGVLFANTPKDAAEAAGKILGSKIKGLRVKTVLIEEMLDVINEYYAGIVVDGSVNVKAPVLVFSLEGGTGIEEVAARNPERIFKLIIDPVVGLEPDAIKKMLKKAEIDAEKQKDIGDLLLNLYEFFKKSDASAAEINPFVITKDNNIYAADCHVTIDDNSVFRHPEFGIKIPRDMDREPTELEVLAWDQIEEGDYRGTGYFAQMITEFDPSETYVGFHGIGGGGSMLGAAALINRGIKIANYADTSGDPPASKIYKVIKSIFSLPISAYAVLGACLANQEQWYHSFAIVKALREELREKPGFPVVILLAGNKENEAMKIIENGLKDLNLRLEIYGRDYIYNSDYIGERLEKLMSEYLNNK